MYETRKQTSRKMYTKRSAKDMKTHPADVFEKQAIVAKCRGIGRIHLCPCGTNKVNKNLTLTGFYS